MVLYEYKTILVQIFSYPLTQIVLCSLAYFGSLCDFISITLRIKRYLYS